MFEITAREISEYTGESVDIVKQKHKSGPEREKNYEIFKNQEKLADSEVEGFYKKCAYYLYELSLWNAERNRPKYLRLICQPYLKRNRYKKVMDFGAGAGDLCMELAKNNLQATYCDIGECLFDFAKWRFAKRNLPIKMVRDLDGLSNEEFDCVFSFDAFEHIKDLPVILGKLVRHIKTEGSLIFSGAFSGGSLHLQENEKYDNFKSLDRLMRDFNLIFQDKFAQFYFYKNKKR